MSWLEDYVNTALRIENGAHNEDTYATYDLFVTGGPLVNKTARLLLYGTDQNDTTAKELMEHAQAPWVFDLCPEEECAEVPVSNLQELDVDPRWPIFNIATHERFLPDSFEDTHRDFFLILYTQNPHSKEHAAILAAGCSAPGTTAAKAVLRNDTSEEIEGVEAFHDYLVNGSNDGTQYFIAVGRCHVRDGEPDHVACVDFQLLDE